jgi:hypothetical protein
LCISKLARPKEDIECNMKRASDAYSTDSAARPTQITKMAKMKFLSHAVAGKRTSPRPGSSRASGDPADQGSLDDTAPENETQIDRKRRQNRNNERKKRAKRIVMIEDLTASFHALTRKNEELKTESKQLKESIETVQQYMRERGMATAAMEPDAAQSQEATRNIAAWLGLSPALTVDSLVTAGLPTARNEDVGRSSDAILQGQMTLPAMAVAPTGLTPPEANHAMSGGINSPQLSLLTTEQRMLLLQREFEKQDRIITQLRLQLGISTQDDVGEGHHGVLIAAPSPIQPLIHQQLVAPPSPAFRVPSLFAAASATPAQRQVNSNSNSSLGCLKTKLQIALHLENIQQLQSSGRFF